MKYVLYLAIPMLAGGLFLHQRPDRPDQPPDQPKERRGGMGGMGGGFGGPMMGPGMGQAVMTATEKYLFILRGDQLMQFDIKDLTLVRQTRLPPRDEMDGPDGPPPDGERRRPGRGGEKGGPPPKD